MVVMAAVGVSILPKVVETGVEPLLLEASNFSERRDYEKNIDFSAGRGVVAVRLCRGARQARWGGDGPAAAAARGAGR